MERRRRSHEFRPADVLGTIMVSPESAERVIENLTTEQLTSLINRVLYLIIEVDPSLKNYYQRLANYLIGFLTAKIAGDDPDPPVFKEEFTFNTRTGQHIMRTIIGRTGNLPHLCQVMGLDPSNVDQSKLRIYSFNIASEDGSFHINLQLFKDVIYEGRRVNYLYIADRYASSGNRGDGIGDGLLNVANSIAVANNCSAICAQLIPENPDDMDLLKRGHEKVGYQITTRPNSGVIAIKHLG